MKLTEILVYVNANNSEAAFNFIVHDPRGIIEVVSERSFLSRDFIYLIISVSE